MIVVGKVGREGGQRLNDDHDVVGVEKTKTLYDQVKYLSLFVFW